MKTFTLFILLIFAAICSSAQKVADKVIPYDYDTTLKSGYSISFKVDDSLQYLYLKKGNKIIAEISSTTKGLPYKNLGYPGADFSNYFVLVHSYGSGNPHNIELIKKSTGGNMLDPRAAWIDVDLKLGYLLYSDHDVPNAKDKMTLLNIRTMKKKQFNFPADIFDGPQVLNRIHIGRLTEKSLMIKYETEKGSKTKLYNR